MIVSSDFAKISFQLLKELTIAKGLLSRGKGMNVGHLRHAAGHHLSGAVQLHGAGTLKMNVIRSRISLILCIQYLFQTKGIME